jgi:phosphoribulokinase
MDSVGRGGMERPIFVAIGGDSGSGKSTLTAGFYRIFPRDQITSVCLDDYHGLDRRERNLIGITALNPRANNFALMENQLLALKRGNPIMKPVYDHSDGTFGPPEERGGHRPGIASLPRAGPAGPVRPQCLA